MFSGQTNGASYYGKLIGKLSELHHGVSGEVYAVDGRTLYIKDFTYDGQGPGKLMLIHYHFNKIRTHKSYENIYLFLCNLSNQANEI